MTAPAGIVAFVGRDPEPGLESSLVALRLGIVPIAEVLPVLPAWPLIVLSADERRPEPLVVQGPDARPLLAAFTSPDRTRGVDGHGRWQLWLRASILAQGARGGAGLVVNPGSEPSLTLTAEQLGRIAAAPAALDDLPAEHPPGSRALTSLERAIMAVRSAARPAKAVFDALAASTVTVLSATDPAQSMDPAAVGGALAVFTDESMIPADLAGAFRVRVLGADLPALADGRFDRTTIDPHTGYALTVPFAAISR